ncbi:glycosyl hydrolase family 81 protein [Artemisia annua]|uniref:glucan endo-1,3-beta-D-glucosidase n=1 Tax=Artemisia annua TaxID=35608 RepID=A0A2U1MNI1_ARTAN|nr:glycosyl hydrolase family 81 protein [Artemisia annua]
MVLKKIRRRVERIITKPFKKPPRKPSIKPPSPPQSPTPEPPTAIMIRRPTHPFTFPEAQSNVLPDPSTFFSPNLLTSPLPTNSFFQNFVLKKGDQAEYIHPYLIKSSPSSLSISYPSLFTSAPFTYQIFNADLTISAIDNHDPKQAHVISSFNDLSVTLDLPNLRFYLVRGCPFLTCQVLHEVALSISTIHAILDFTQNSSKTRYKFNLNNGQTWVLYSSSSIDLTHEMSTITSLPFSGIIRIALVPNSDTKLEQVLDEYSSCYPVSGDAVFGAPYCVEYKWDKKGWGNLLMLANPLHLRLLDQTSSMILDEFRYNSIDGELVGVIGDSWVLNTDPVSVTWHSIKGIKAESYPEIVKALVKDVEGLDSTSISTTSSYFYGKLVARAARLALIAEEIGHLDVMPKIQKYLKDTIEPWLDGTFSGNGFVYDKSWGGIITKQGSQDSGADFGFGIYNDHHYHIGYFLYGIAVLAKLDPIWGRKYKPQAYSLMADFMTLGRGPNKKYTRLRCFDLWKLHSWAGGLTEFADGRNQESTSEAVNAYYSAALMGLAYGDTHLVAIGSLILAMEIHAAQTWWHVKEDDVLYPKDFTSQNRVVGVLWANKRDSGLWFAPADWKECRLEIQVIPLLPITEVLFSDVEFVKQLVTWTMPALGREGVGEGWKGFVYALEGVYDKDVALEKIRSLKGHDDGNSLSNLLWWIHSRDEGDHQGYEGGFKHSWFGHYCH